MGPSVQAIAKGKGAATKLFQVIDNVPTIVDGEKVIDKMEGSIEFENVQFSYPARPNVTILSEFNLKVEAGKTVALVGLSGSGKSTIIQLVERFYDVQNGCIKIDGVPIKELKLKLLRLNIGLVSQEPIL
ncbi:GTPase-activating protein, partial [Coelomomyces lativittatus]